MNREVRVLWENKSPKWRVFVYLNEYRLRSGRVGSLSCLRILQLAVMSVAGLISQELAIAQREGVVIQPLALINDGDQLAFTRSIGVSLGDDSGSFTLRLRRLPNIRLEAGELNSEGDDGLDNRIAVSAEKRFQRILASLEKVSPLSKEQKTKLRNAAKADAGALKRDVKRWLAETEEGRKLDDRQIRQDLASLSDLNEQLNARIYGKKSIYVKVFEKTLDEQQANTVARSYLTWFVAEHKRLNGEQREKLLSMLVDTCESVPKGLARANYCVAVASKLPADELDKLVGRAERRIIRTGAELIKP